MQKKQLWIVIRQTFVNRLKTVGYWMLVLTPILILAAIAGINFVVQATQNNTAPKIGVVQNQPLVHYLDKQQQLDADIKGYAKTSTANKALADEKIDAVLVEHQQQFTLTKRANGQSIDQKALQSALTQYNTINRAKALQVSDDTLQQLMTPPKMSTHIQSQKGVNKDGANSNAANYGVAVALGILIFMFLTSYVGMIAQEIANEKSSRIMEILLAATSPGVQFFGKIGGIGLLALLHGAIYLILGIIASFWLPKISQLKGVLDMLQGIDWSFALMTMLIVIVSIFLYMILTAIIAAMVNDLSQVQQAVAPVTYISLIGYILTFVLNGQPHNAFLNILSYVPFVSQTLMPARLGLQYATMTQASIALTLEVMTLYFLSKYGLRVYKRNVLTYREGNITKAALLSLKGLFKAH